MASNKQDTEKRRLAAIQRYVIDDARAEFKERYGDVTFAPMVALICAYDEEDNIGDVLAQMPTEACGMPVTTLVIVDGGEDKTAEIARNSGAYTFAFPVNLGHGVALRVGYQLCIEHGVNYVVTLDADGQNDPVEIPVMLEPLVNDESDFVVASRRLGEDKTNNTFRKVGVRFFSAIVNAMTGANLTDTSNGYRALRTTMLADVVPRLEQVQYQTAELIITALRRGWRVSEKPTMWYPRAHGTTKKGNDLLFGFRYANVVFRTRLRER